ncbi:MAG: hypothetical protein ACIALR_03825 [Blastopirellula sp. JB062]
MIQRLFRYRYLAMLLAVGFVYQSAECFGGRLYVGGASISITPDEPVALSGQRRTRIAKTVESPCTATALALETRDGDQSLAQTIFVSCDLVAIRGGEEFYDEVRAELKGRVPDEVLQKLVINATHTHTGPVTLANRYNLPAEGVMAPEKYRAWLMKQLGDVIAEAWEKRAPGRVAWGLGHAVIAHNRRAVYGNETAAMYGETNSANFRGMEGTEDHGVEILYFWNDADELIATAINVACPSQEVESRNKVNADFWHPVREKLKAKHGEDLNVIAWTGAGGDQSTHLMYREKAEERMRKLRGVDALNDLAQRIVTTWEDVYEVVKKDQHKEVELAYHAETIQLPYRIITEKEMERAKQAISKLPPGHANSKWNQRWHGSVVDRYERQQSESLHYDMTLRAVRIGDVAIATNDFELFTDFGVQMKSRSPALQTFVIQLCGSGSYLPTVRGVRGGGYSAVAESSVIGPVGGQVLVNETVDAIKSLWPSDDKSKSQK